LVTHINGENTDRAFYNTALTRILEMNRMKVIAGWRKPNDEDFHKSFTSSNYCNGQIYENGMNRECRTRVEAGPNTSTVTLRVVGGD
jgi:hypothetical protein